MATFNTSTEGQGASPPLVKVLRQNAPGSWTARTQQSSAFCDERLNRSDSHVEIAITDLSQNHRGLDRDHRRALDRLFCLSNSFWRNTHWESSGYFAIRCVGEERRDNFILTTRFLVKRARDHAKDSKGPIIHHRWLAIVFITRWTEGTGSVTMAASPDPHVQNELERKVYGLDQHVSRMDPFAPVSVLLEQVVDEFESAIWSWRDYVREIETTREGKGASGHEYERMHELARHAIHCTETSVAGLKVVESIIEEHDIWVAHSGSGDLVHKREYQAVSRSLRGHRSLLNSLCLRSGAIEERMKNEISLAFNAVSQGHSSISNDIAKAALSDSASTKTISVLGLIFFPFALVGSIFSTTFFDVSTVDDPTGNGELITRWRMASQFWIFWAFALPLTAFTFLAWTLWSGPEHHPAFVSNLASKNNTATRRRSRASGILKGLSHEPSVAGPGRKDLESRGTTVELTKVS